MEHMQPGNVAVGKRLNKRIKQTCGAVITSPSAKVTEVEQLALEQRLADVRNKERRSYLMTRLRRLKAALRSARRQESHANEQGDSNHTKCDFQFNSTSDICDDRSESLHKKLPKTIDNLRTYDVTVVDPLDHEVMDDQLLDEMAAYFDRKTVPKVLLTTSYKTSKPTRAFCRQLQHLIPNSTVVRRNGLPLKRLIKMAEVRYFTDLVVINDDQKHPNGLWLIHLPAGPTAHFKLSSVRFQINNGRRRNQRLRKGDAYEPLKDYPEIIINNFRTRLGHTLARMLAALFPQDPNFISRTVVTFHNQRDFIFVRRHRYQFCNAPKTSFKQSLSLNRTQCNHMLSDPSPLQASVPAAALCCSSSARGSVLNSKARLQELGPRFTLKLRSLQLGTFDSIQGDYIWIHKRRHMDASRRTFFL